MPKILSRRHETKQKKPRDKKERETAVSVAAAPGPPESPAGSCGRAAGERLRLRGSRSAKMASLSRTLRFAALIRPSAVLSVVPRAATVGCLHTLTSKESRLSNTTLLSAITKVMLSTAGSRRRQRVYREDQLIIPSCLESEGFLGSGRVATAPWMWI